LEKKNSFFPKSVIAFFSAAVSCGFFFIVYNLIIEYFSSGKLKLPF